MKIKELFMKELERIKVPIDEDGQFDNHSALEALEKEIVNESTKLHNMIHTIINPRNLKTISLHWFKTVATLS